jgi:glutamate-1-semialdehyde 2,1-aminomutase
VLPEPGYHDALREITERTGTLLVLDETHTMSSGPGGYTGAHGLRPDALTVGKSIAGGIPIGAYGLRRELGDRLLAGGVELDDTGAFGSTLGGNALSMAAARATLGHVLSGTPLVSAPRAVQRRPHGPNKPTRTRSPSPSGSPAASAM